MQRIATTVEGGTGGSENIMCWKRCKLKVMLFLFYIFI